MNVLKHQITHQISKGRSAISKLLTKEMTPEAVKSVDSWDLDTPLLKLSEYDYLTLGQAFQGMQVFGATGSGKTSGSGSAIAKSLLRLGAGGLVLCAKPDERRYWEQLARETGRSQDLVIITDSAPFRFNFLNYEYKRAGKGGGLTENLVNLLITVVEIVEGKQGMETGDRFWDRAMQELLRNAIDLLTICQNSITLEDICNLVQDAPQSAEQVGDEAWQNASFCAQCIRLGNDKDKTASQNHDFDMAVRYWLKTHANLADRTRSSVVATFTSVADMLLHGMARELLCTTTNVVPENAYIDGVIFVCDLSIQEYDQLGRIVQGIWKYMFQKSILRRDPEKFPRPVFLWADEAQNFISRFDYQYQSVARSARAATIFLTQNISNYYAVLGNSGRDQANALLSNFVTHIYHQNTGVTNQFASDLIAQHHTTSFNFSTSYTEKGTTQSGGGSDSLEYKVMPAEFTALRTGGYSNQQFVDAILFQGGRIFHASGDTWLKVTFKQGQ